MPEYSVRSLTSPGPRAGSSYSLTETSLGPSNVTTRPTDGSSLFDGPRGQAPDEEALEGQHGEHGDAGAREREHDAPEDLELARAVDPGGVREILRQVHVERPHEEDPDGQPVPAGARDKDEDHAELRA